MLFSSLFSGTTCNALPMWSAASQVPIGEGLIYDPANPSAPVLKPVGIETQMCKVNPEMDVDGTAEPGLWGTNAV